MLLRHRSPDIDSAPATLPPGLEHLDQGWVAVLRWLNAHKIDFVLVGSVARAIRGGEIDGRARGPVSIVPAPYGRNLDRLADALAAQDARLRSTRAGAGSRAVDPGAEVRLTGDKLARGRRWLLTFAGYDLDVESSGTRAPGSGGSHGPHGPAATTGDGSRYQELLLEASRCELAPGVVVEVAAPEDIEHFSHVRRTGAAPEFRITRRDGSADGADAAGTSVPASDESADL
jgi:hypothetical protein